MAAKNNQNKVFISYRREPTKFIALLLFKELIKRGYDVFWDIEGIGSGRFDQVILNQIKARPFLSYYCHMAH